MKMRGDASRRLRLRLRTPPMAGRNVSQPRRLQQPQAETGRHELPPGQPAAEPYTSQNTSHRIPPFAVAERHRQIRTINSHHRRLAVTKRAVAFAAASSSPVEGNKISTALSTESGRYRRRFLSAFLQQSQGAVGW